MSVRVELPSIIAHLPAGSAAPALLAPFAAWLEKQKRGAAGWFDTFAGGPIPRELLPEGTDLARAAAHLTVFLGLPDGSLLALWYHDAEPAVVLLGSEGELTTVAVTFRAFLDKLARAETGVGDLDDEEASAGRSSLAALVERAPSTSADAGRAPSFTHWLETGETVLEGVPRAGEQSLRALRELLPRAMGKPVDDADAAALLAAIWEGARPAPTLGTTYLGNKPAGFCVYLKEGTPKPSVEGCFFYAGGTEGYERFPGELPHGIAFGDGRDALVEKLGPPQKERVSKKTGKLVTMGWKLPDDSLVWISFDGEARIENLSWLHPGSR